MPQYAERQIVRSHAGPVIGDLDTVDPAAIQRHRDPPRAGIQRILHQLFDGSGRPLDHLTGGDAVDRGFRENTDNHYVSPRRVRNRAIRAVVELSCAPGTAPGVNSGRIPPASCLPSSTPHWSKLLIPHRQPCTATLCS